MTDLLSSSLEPVVIYTLLVCVDVMVEGLTSLGNTPGAIVLTRTFVPANVVANIRLRCVAAALLDAYANCPLLLPFIYPEILETLMTLDVYPGVTSLPFARRGKNCILM
jgi:hypothetical protein